MSPNQQNKYSNKRHQISFHRTVALQRSKRNQCAFIGIYTSMALEKPNSLMELRCCPAKNYPQSSAPDENTLVLQLCISSFVHRVSIKMPTVVWCLLVCRHETVSCLFSEVYRLFLVHFNNKKTRQHSRLALPSLTSQTLCITSVERLVEKEWFFGTWSSPSRLCAVSRLRSHERQCR